VYMSERMEFFLMTRNPSKAVTLHVPTTVR